MKRTQVDRYACFWSCRLLPDHVDKLEGEVEDAEGYETICINNRIERATEELEEIQEKYEELKSRGIK